jgi:RNA polymerase sigma factor (sigma-70 family)
MHGRARRSTPAAGGVPAPSNASLVEKNGLNMPTPTPHTDPVAVSHPVFCTSAQARPSAARTRDHKPAAQAWSRERGERMFLENLRSIQRLAKAVARQHQLSSTDAEEFAAEVQFRIIADDYAVLRKFRGQSTLRTFLTVVIVRMCLDYRIREWGKWRPSAWSRREGDVAVLLERLTVRDGFTFEEACAVLETKHAKPVDRHTLERIYGGFRRRGRPRFVSEQMIVREPVSAATADGAVIGAEENDVVRRAIAALAVAFAAIGAQDRLLLKLHFCDGLTVAAVARKLQLNQKHLYPRIDRLRRRLGVRLESAGVRGADVLAAIGRCAGDGANVLTLGDVAAPDTSPEACC